MEILWDIALATLTVQLASIYFLATLGSSLAICYLDYHLHFFRAAPATVLAPALLVSMAASALFVVKRYQVPRVPSVRLATGFVALALMATAHMVTGAVLEGGGWSGWMVDAGSGSGLVSAGLLVAFALMPALLMMFEGEMVVDAV